MKTSAEKSSSTTSKTVSRSANPAFFAKAGGGGFFAPAIQMKMAVNKPGDKFEQEADRTADNVMRMENPAPFSPASGIVQRKCAACETTQATCQDCAEKQPVQRKEKNDSTLQANPSVQPKLTPVRGAGQALSPSLRGFFEPRFGRDFSKVRVHTGESAAKSAQAIQAKAYTYGPDIVFGSGEYAPDTNAGKRLIAHELTHVVQQGHSPEMTGKPSLKDQRESRGGEINNAESVKTDSQVATDTASAFKPQSHLNVAGPVNRTPDHNVPIPQTLPGLHGNPVNENLGRPATDTPTIPSADTIATSVAATSGREGGGNAQLIKADSLRSEAQIMQIGSANRQRVNRVFGGLRSNFSGFLTQTSVWVTAFLALKQAQLAATAAGMLTTAQTLMLNMSRAIEILANRIRQTITGLVQGIVASLQQRVQGIADQIANTITRFPLPNIPGVAQLRTFAANILRQASGAVTSGLSQAHSLINSALNLGMTVIQSVINTAQQLATALLAQVSAMIQRILQMVFQMLSRMAGLIISLLRQAFNATVIPLLNRLEGMVLQALGKAQDQAIAAIRDNRDQSLEAAPADSDSDSPVAESIKTNRMIVETFQERTSSIIGLIFERISSGVSQIVQRITQSVSQVFQLIAGKVQEAISRLNQILQAIRSFIQSVVQAVTDTLTRVVAYVRILVENPVDALVRFAQGILDRMFDFMGRLVRTAINMITGAVPLSSPITGRFSSRPSLVPAPAYVGPVIPVVIAIVTAIVVWLGGSVIVIGGTVMIIIGGTVIFVSTTTLVIIVVVVALLLLLLLIYLLYRIFRRKKPKKPEKIISKTKQAKPSPRTRTSIGVGEEVHLTYTGGSTTWSTTSGIISPVSGSTTWLTAPDVAGSVTVTAGTATIGFSVIAPSGVFMERRGAMKHTVNQPDSGVRMRPYLLPDTVNFYNVIYHEMDVTFVATPGVYSCNPGKNGHCGAGGGGVPCPDLSVTNNVAGGKGTETVQDDCAYSGHCGTPPPFAQGSVLGSIPHEYKVGGGSVHSFAPVLQVHKLAADGQTLTTDKAAAHGQTTVSSATSGNGC